MLAKSTRAIPVLPTIDDDTLQKWRLYVDRLPGDSPIKKGLDYALGAVEAWWQEPESTNKNVYRRYGRTIKRKKIFALKTQALDKEIIERLWDKVPWDYELQELGHQVKKYLEKAPVSAEDKRIIYGILAYAWELTCDREPRTLDSMES